MSRSGGTARRPISIQPKPTKGPEARIPPEATIEPAHLQRFREDLIAWYNAERREMPWRDSDDPYEIWISEVMLQQTRVDQAEPYYRQFVERFPTVEDLAGAELDDVLLCWEGLGYYSRARNLHAAARKVVDEFSGEIPSAQEDIRSLPGVGPYTAAAVLSIAYEKPHAALDGNVVRVLTRVFRVDADAKKSSVRRMLGEAADHLLDVNRPGAFNQALMELGATLCTPRAPKCADCPLWEVCEARRDGHPENYPVTAKRKPVPHHDISVGLIRDAGGRLLIQKRPHDAMLGGLWEFPGGKRKPEESLQEACRREIQEELGVDVEVGDRFHRLSHAYSHFRITLHAFPCVLLDGEPAPTSGEPMEWVEPGKLDAYAFPRANRKLIERLTDADLAAGAGEGSG